MGDIWIASVCSEKARTSEIATEMGRVKKCVAHLYTAWENGFTSDLQIETY